jgi:2-dehydro-3-deoxyphosphogluconate aldolase/(4S)-4-hydroxy-2-oxoglutarate aldolase
VEEAIKIGLPFAPGISTASEIEASVELGCRVLKFFPAENMGGLKYLEAVNNPYGFLNLKYIPLGGLNMQNLSSWLEKPYILAVGGSWIAPKSLIAQKAWETITDNAARAMAIFHNVRG